ncbi:MAG TPA: hypothetical protein VF163_18315 [Micromonosporaceae bacterium]
MGTEPAAELDQLSTEDLRQRAFTLAAKRRDIGFFWSIFKHLPHADDTESLDASLGAVGASISDAISLWREFTGHEYGDAEPLLRAAFIDYLTRHAEVGGPRSD